MTVSPCLSAGRRCFDDVGAEAFAVRGPGEKRGRDRAAGAPGGGEGGRPPMSERRGDPATLAARGASVAADRAGRAHAEPLGRLTLRRTFRNGGQDTLAQIERIACGTPAQAAQGITSNPDRQTPVMHVGRMLLESASKIDRSASAPGARSPRDVRWRGP